MNYVKLIPRFVIRQSDYLKIRGQNYKKSSISPKENRQKLQFCLFYSKRLCDAAGKPHPRPLSEGRGE